MTLPSSDLEERLLEEAMRLSGYSLNRGSVDAGIASNLAEEAAVGLSQLRRQRADLLGALQACLNEMRINHAGDDGYWRVVEMGEAIIAKAEGRP